jgi:uncharacterized protein (TIGR00725 family)
VREALIFIGVLGGHDISARTALVAAEVGREIARRGAGLGCGGMGGVMEAACRGASEAGGVTIGIPPRDNRYDANSYVKIPIITGLGTARNVVVVKSSQAVIAIDGSYGTLTEIGYALQNDIPVIGLKTWSVMMDGQVDKNILLAESPQEAVAQAISLIKNS